VLESERGCEWNGPHALARAMTVDLSPSAQPRHAVATDPVTDPSDWNAGQLMDW